MNKKPPSSARVDERIYLTMGCLAVLSILIFAFRFAVQRPCAPIYLRVSSGSFIRGTLINFTADTKGGTSYEWNFGDGTGAKGSDPSTGHNYAVAGRYTVSVTVNGECTELQSVVIKEAKVIINNTLQPVISVVDTAFVNVPMTVEDLSPSSTSWAWTFEEGASVDSYTRKASHKYMTAGTKLIHLEVNGRSDLQMSRWILVIDPNAAKVAPAAATPRAAHNSVTVIQIPTKPSEQPLTVAPTTAPAKAEPTKAPEITENAMATMLQGVSDNGKTAEDFAPYLCGNVGITVIYNGDKMTFAKMCDNIKAIKKGRIKSLVVQITKDQNNCILAMDVKLKTKWKLL